MSAKCQQRLLRHVAPDRASFARQRRRAAMSAVGQKTTLCNSIVRRLGLNQRANDRPIGLLRKGLKRDGPQIAL